ncbi:hypothetical protein EPN96_03485 [bacterium]|nr:MAG: hypothetical protein EPN96_03485 [bacterium]
MFEWLSNSKWTGISALAGIAAIYFESKRRKLHIKKASTPSLALPKSEAHELVGRFVAIYKAHGIERMQIPRFLGDNYGLKIAHLETDEKLMHEISDTILNYTCSSFGITRNWLDGVKSEIYPYKYYDKNLRGFIDFLESIKAEHGEIQAFVIKCESDRLQKDESRFHVAFVFRGLLYHWDDIGEKSIWRYYPLNDTLCWGYTRTRIQIKAMVLVLWQFNIHPFGCVLPEKDVNNLVEGLVFPEPLIPSHWVAWYPDDYIFAEGESCQVADGKEALAVREEMERMGWMKYLIEKTGPLRVPHRKS